jgi:hypothetical protein
MFRSLIVFAAVATAALAHAQQPANPQAAPAAPTAAPQGTAAERFGVRESVIHIDISPDGQKVVYLQPGPGRSTMVYISDLTANSQPRLVIRSAGNAERVNWCDFVDNDRLICRVSGMINSDGVLAPFSRLVSMDTNGQDLKLLGQTSSYYDARIRQFDGEVLDWLPGANGEILMARELIPEAGRTGSHVVRTADGMVVQRVNVCTLASR